MNLVIVESPSKASTIKKYLGKGYTVKASQGHVIDLPKSKMGIDVEHDFKPTYEVTKPKALKELKSAFKEADKLILAVDLDREGEAIGWHIAQKLGVIDAKGKKKGKIPVERIVFHEITKSAIEEAIKSPREIDMNLVNAQQSRRFLDRLVGYTLSPVLWKKLFFGLSAGRVQSAALRLVVEREQERRAFKSDEYWDLMVYAKLKGSDAINRVSKIDVVIQKKEDEKIEVPEAFIALEVVKYKDKSLKIVKEKEATDHVANLEKADYKVIAIDTKITKRYPKAPFITSTLQQAAVNVLGFSSSRTMSLAQKLYEWGHITYMRTDSVQMAAQAVQAARIFVKNKYGEKYIPANPIAYANKSKNSQEAHECIRPVEFGFEPSSDKKLTNDHIKLYNLIRNRTLASQMNPAEIETMTVTVKAGDYDLRARGSQIMFDGYLKLYPEKLEDRILPDMKEGDVVHPHKIVGGQHFTQPPARYSEASIIKKLEELGIGRPSTYASIIGTLVTRKYVVKEQRYLIPTDTGEVVSNLLVKYFNQIVDYQFTSNMEEDLDKVAEGKEDWLKMLKDFFLPFEKEVKSTEKNIPKEEFNVLGEAPEDIKCPECGSKMLIKLGRFGKFYSCSKWPDCKGILSIDGTSQEDLEKEAETDEFKNMYLPAPKTDDGRDYLLKKGRYGKFWAHPDYPKVKDAQPLKLTPEKEREIYGEPPKTDKGENFLLRSGKYGMFWAHPEYPKVKEIRKIAKKVEAEAN